MTAGSTPQGFDGTLYGVAPEGAALSGQVYVAGGQVVFSSPASVLSIPLAEAQVRVGGATGHTTFISHPQRPEQMIIVVSTDFQKLPEIARLPGVREAVRKSRRGIFCCVGCIGAILLAVAVLVVAFIASRDSIVAWTAERIPYNMEVKLGQVVLDSMDDTAPLVTDPAVESLLRELSAPVEKAVLDLDREQQGGKHLPEPFTMYLAAIDEPNAFALPGRIIVVNRGLVTSAKSAEEVLGVIAHEMGHGIERHSLRGMVDRLGLQALAMLFAGDGGTISGAVMAGGAHVFSQTYSRTQERRADQWALDSLNRAGISPAGLVSFFGRLKDEHGDTSGLMTFASTHPALSERIENISKLLPKELPPTDAGREEKFRQLQGLLTQ